MTDRKYIFEHFYDFQSTWSLPSLFAMARSIYEQNRTRELLHGARCFLFGSPSELHADHALPILDLLSRLRSTWREKTRSFSRTELVQRLSPSFRAEELPDDFRTARAESTVCTPNYCVIGEYGSKRSLDSRIVLLTKTKCVVDDSYVREGADHIHCVKPFDSSGRLLVCTGDGLKVLDLWQVRGDSLVFLTRLRAELAGYTGAARVRGTFYFGTDFSFRPNYLETLAGERYFFPKKAYLKWVLGVYPFQDRYLCCLNTDMHAERTLSVFDTRERVFVYCDTFRE